MNKIFAVMALSFSSFVFAGNWYEGGTLHKTTVSTWKSATNENKLATSADFVMVVPSIKSTVLKSGSIDTAKVFAKELVTCIDTATNGVNVPNDAVTTMATSCMILMGWLK